MANGMKRNQEKAMFAKFGQTSGSTGSGTVIIKGADTSAIPSSRVVSTPSKFISLSELKSVSKSTKDNDSPSSVFEPSPKSNKKTSFVDLDDVGEKKEKKLGFLDRIRAKNRARDKTEAKERKATIKKERKELTRVSKELSGKRDVEKARLQSRRAVLDQKKEIAQLKAEERAIKRESFDLSTTGKLFGAGKRIVQSDQFKRLTKKALSGKKRRSRAVPRRRVSRVRASATRRRAKPKRRTRKVKKAFDPLDII